MARPKKRSSGTSRSTTTAPRPATAGARADVASPAAEPATVPAADTPSRRSDSVDWNSEYSYVIGDLKQMAVVTVALFAVMIAIGFVL